MPVEPGRYRLVVARACPWANRAIIVRRLLGLEDADLDGRVRARPTTSGAGRSTSTPAAVDPVLGIERLQEAYLARDPGLRPRASPCRRSSTSRRGEVVTNDFAQITLDLSTEWRDHHRAGAPDLYPERAAATRSTR